MRRLQALFLGLFVAFSLATLVPAADAQVVVNVGHRHYHHHHYYHHHHHYYRHY